MSSKEVIRVENLSKWYKLGVYSADTLVEEMKHWIKRKSNQVEQDYAGNNRVDDRGNFWALRDVSFSVNEGEILGIIGKNGAGKSTLLKILSRITSPKVGEIKIRGRVASLLEVGTGFHPELTGRENIFLNGAILGMTRSEISSKLEEIIEFSGVKNHIDTPVKRYSSGMKVRLGFAVAAHLEPEILVVDEVLAVGDAEFQKKCLGKMQSVSKSGRTILFVSHNMTAVKSLCTRTILLEEGRLVFQGNTDEAIGRYLGGEYSKRTEIAWKKDEFRNEDVEMISAKVFTDEINGIIAMDKPFKIQLNFQLLSLQNRVDFTLQFKGSSGDILFTTGTGSLEANGSIVGQNSAVLNIPSDLFNSGVVEANLLVVKNRREIIFEMDSLFSFSIIDSKRIEGQWMGRSKGDMAPRLKWEIVN